jgi:uncharacterized membrane protein
VQEVTLGADDARHMRGGPAAAHTPGEREGEMDLTLFGSVVVPALRAFHIGAGCVALVSMWVPMLARKGGPLHRRAGRVFVGAMALVSATGLVISSYRLASATRAWMHAGAVFLLYVSLLTAAGAFKGMRVLKRKQRVPGRRDALAIAVAAGLVLASLPVMLLGASLGSPLLTWFPVIGVVGGSADLRYWLQQPRERMHWWYEHMGDMLGTCIAALSAFLVVNAQNLGLPRFSLFVWLLPTLVGVPAIVVWTLHYRRRFERPAGAALERVQPAA